MTARMVGTLLGITAAVIAAAPVAAFAAGYLNTKPWSVEVQHCNADSYRHYRDHKHADALYVVKRHRFRTDRSIAVVAEEHHGQVVRIVQRRCS